jgi:hypothetical protein
MTPPDDRMLSRISQNGFWSGLSAGQQSMVAAATACGATRRMREGSSPYGEDAAGGSGSAASKARSGAAGRVVTIESDVDSVELLWCLS